MTGGNGSANPYRGDTVLVLAGKSYLLRLSMNVCATLEQTLEVRGAELLETLRLGGWRVIRAVMHACLTAPNRRGERQLPADTTVDAVGWMLDDEGGLYKYSPVSCSYWELLLNTHFAEREEVEHLLPPGKAPSDTGDGAGGLAPVQSPPIPAGT